MPSFFGSVRNTTVSSSTNAVVTPFDARQADMLATRQNQLYPAGHQAHGIDAEVLQLPALRGPDADALLRRVLGRHTVKQAWNDAVKKQQPDKLRALLMLVDEHDIKQELATPLFNSPMHQALHKPGLTDAGLDEVIKGYPYYSSKPTDEGRAKAPKNYNGKGVFPETSMCGARKIVCRHLAIQQAGKMQENALAKVDYEQEFGNVKTIQNKVQPDTELRYVMRLAYSPEVYLVSNAKFGEFISEQFKAMESAGETKKTMILGGHYHVMSLGMRIKNKDGKTCYVTKFYDPNQTTAHARSATAHLNTIETTSINDFLSSGARARLYFPKGHGSTAVFVAPPEGMTDNAGAEKIDGGERKLASSSAELDVGTLHQLAKWGFGADLRDYVPAFSALPDEQKIALLADEISGRTMLQTAMLAPTGKTIVAFAKLLDEVRSDRRPELVGKRNENGMNAVGAALKQPNTLNQQLADFPAVLALIEIEQRAPAIDSAKITMHSAYPQLNRFARVLTKSVPKRHGFEESGLVAAVKSGDCAAIRAYGELIKMVRPEDRPPLVFEEDRATIYQMGRNSPDPDAAKEYDVIADLAKLNIFRPN